MELSITYSRHSHFVDVHICCADGHLHLVHTVIDFYNFLREVCCVILQEQSEPIHNKVILATVQKICHIIWNVLIYRTIHWHHHVKYYANIMTRSLAVAEGPCNVQCPCKPC